ncbi:MAG: hypothetical protein RID07_04210 [Lacipirellulaceae bacterium]
MAKHPFRGPKQGQMHYAVLSPVREAILEDTILMLGITTSSRFEREKPEVTRPTLLGRRFSDFT